MRKNRMMRLASALLILTMVTTCAISGTFAKYTSTSTATDAARVAKWSFKVNNTDIAVSNTFQFEVFKTVSDGNVATAAADEDAIIAPGTSGNLSVDVKNDSEVNAEYTVAYTASEAGVPLQWSLDGSTWKDDISALDIEDDAAVAVNMGATSSVKLYWKWAFEDDAIVTQSDPADTELGKAGTAAPSVTITVTATQVD